MPDWIQPDPEARAGALDELDGRSRRFGGSACASTCRRASARPAAIRSSSSTTATTTSATPGMKTVLDNLIDRLEIPDGRRRASRTSPDRLREYANDTGHVALPHRGARARARARATRSSPRPQGRCLLGASFGAVASLSTAWRAPGFYGRLLLQSGELRLHRHRPLQPPRPALRPGRRLHEQVPRRAAPSSPRSCSSPAASTRA